MYHINRLRETFLIQSDVPNEIETGIAKVKAAYSYESYYKITTFKQTDKETIVQVWEQYRLND